MPQTIGYERNNKLKGRLSAEMRDKFHRARDLLQHAQMYREQEREAAWRSSYDQYMNLMGWEKNDDPTADTINVNVSFSTINTLIPLVADENPRFLVEPYAKDANPENAAVLQAYMNRMWESDDMMGQIHLRDGVFDYLVYGDGMLKVQWKINTTPTYDARGEVVTDESGDIVGQDTAEFHVKRVSPWDFWFDPYSDGMHNARWVCERIFMPLEELKKDDRYKVSKDEMGGDTPNVDNFAPEDEDRVDNVQSWVAVYHFYDMVENYMIAFSLSGENPMRYIEHVKAPFVQIPNYRIPNSPYHLGELEQIEGLQHELNKTRSQMITHRRRNVMKWAINRNVGFDEDAIAAMKSGKVNDVIPVDLEIGIPLQNAITAITPAPLSGDSYMIDAQIRSDINEITGVNEYLRGQPTDIRRTATEASIIEGATNIRTRHKLHQIEVSARQLGQLLLDILIDVIPQTDFEEMSQYITGREAERLNRSQGVDQSQGAMDAVVTPLPEVFQGKYVVFVERGSVELRDPNVKARKFKEIATTMMSAQEVLRTNGITFNLRRILELWFEAEGISDVEALFELDEQQLQAQDLQKQMQLMQALGGAQGGGGGAGVTGGGRTPPGEPREQTTAPPEEKVTSGNSGMLPPAAV